MTAQRHGLRIKPVDILRSEWNCVLEREPEGAYSLRLGLAMYVACALPSPRRSSASGPCGPFGSIEELARRVPSLSQPTSPRSLKRVPSTRWATGCNRRDALWQVECAGRQAGPLLSALDSDEEQESPLRP